MSKIGRRENGQALILIAFAAIGLVAMVGLAVDGSIKFSDLRHAQNAADTSALAGALSIVDGNTNEIDGIPVWKLDAWDRALSNGYDNDLVTNTVEVYRCNEGSSSCGPYDGIPNYVQVIINSYVDTTFARVIGVMQLHNRVEAVTYVQEPGPLYDGNLIVALNPDSCSGGGADGNITFGGDSDITLDGGGAFVNSGGDGECGLNMTGCPTITFVDSGLGSAGSGNIDLESSSATCEENITPSEITPSYGNDPFPFPPVMPDVPTECSTTRPNPTHNDYTLTSTLYPGYYSEFPPKPEPGGPKLYDNQIMTEGIYCVDDLIKLNDQNLTLIGSNVLIYIRNGSGFSFEGGTIQLTGRQDGYSYAGYLIIVESDFSGMPEACKIDGNVNNIFTGTIFAPYCDMTINGTGGQTSYSSQIIAYTVKITGTSGVNLYYTQSDNAESSPQIGLMR